MRPFLEQMERYSIIQEKNPREIVLLRGNGCKWKKCAFCDYHTDSSKDESANYALNREVLSKVTGQYHRLEVINSGSFIDLDQQTIAEIRNISVQKQIHTLHFECHWMHRKELNPFSRFFMEEGIRVIYKIGVETFHIPFREEVLRKGMGNVSPEEIASAGFSEINLLCGIDGLSAADTQNDIETGLRYFDRVCVNVMTENSTKIVPSRENIEAFVKEVYPVFRDNPRVDILLENTDFGVGGVNDAE